MRDGERRREKEEQEQGQEREQEQEEEGLFKADAVNEEDPERDRRALHRRALPRQ